jgi:hypothetical protein
MDPLGVAGEYRASLGGCVANGDHEIELVSKEVIHGFREQRGRINPELVLEDRLRHWMNFACRGASCTEDIGAAFRQMTQEGFSDLRASRIAGAQEQNAEAMFRHNVIFLSLPMR